MTKIIIIGAGIGGLAAYHATRKHFPAAEIAIYEAYDNKQSVTAIIGGGLGLAPNGQVAIASISDHAIDYIQANAFKMKDFIFRDEKGHTLGVMSVSDEKRYTYSMVVAARATVHESLMFAPVDGTPLQEKIQWGKRVKELQETETEVKIIFANGETETCDFLIGADGVRSICKEAIIGKDYPAEYNGLTGIGGFFSAADVSAKMQQSLKSEGSVFTFSRAGFFGYAQSKPAPESITDQKLIWWSTFPCDPPLSRDTSMAEIKDTLLKKHAQWKSPYDDADRKVFTDIITSSCLSKSDHKDLADNNNQFLILPQYISPNLPHWTSVTKGHGRIVLLGDAAHTVPPDSGQGVSQAAEDAVVLALVLARYSKVEGITPADLLKNTCKAYEAIRKPRIIKVLELSRRSGNTKREMGWFGEKMRNFAFWLFSHMNTTSFNDVLHSYKCEVAVENHFAKNR